MSKDGLSRGIPVQDLMENQDPAVAYTFDEVTQAKFPFPENYRTLGSSVEEDKPEDKPEEKPAKKRATKKAAASKDAAPDDEGATGDAGEDDEDETPVEDQPVEQASALQVRELGS